MEILNNQLVGLIAHYIKEKKISVAEAVLVLEMIRLDLVKQVSDKAYPKKPVKLSNKEPTKLGDK